MNSLKSTLTVLFLLGVSYGVYRLIHTPDPMVTSDGQFFVQLTPPPLRKTNEAPPAAAGSSTPSPPTTLPQPLAIAANAAPVPEPPATNQPASPGQAAPIPPWSADIDSRPQLASAKSNAISTGPTVPNLSSLPPLVDPPARSAPPDIAAPKLVEPNKSPGEAMTGPLTPVPPADPMKNVAGLITQLPPAAPLAVKSTSIPSSEIQPVPPPKPELDLESVWPIVDSQIRQGQASAALQTLSAYYHESLADAERTELLRWLDALAFKVIYSTEHHLSPTAHIVQTGETIESLAATWGIPVQLLVNVNRAKIPANNALTPGLELKMVRGPFRAEIDCQRRELTLFLDKYYAGRFPIDTANCASLAAGSLRVKSLAENASQPLALELSNGLVLSAAEMANPPKGHCIGLSPSDAQDICGILTANSQVTVIR